MIRRATALALLAASAAIFQAHAQTSPRVINPSRPDQNAPGRTSRGVGLATGAVMPRERNPDAKIIPFTLQGVEISGSSVPQEELARIYAPFVGQTVDNDVLAKITQAVSGAYDHRDVALYTVFVPQQIFAQGRLKLVVVEGYIQSANVRGRLGRRQKALLTAYIARLEEGRPLKTSVLQRYVSLIRDMPGLYPTLNLERGSAEGAVRLVVDVKPMLVQAALGVSNRGTALLGTTQVQGDVFVNGLVAGGDQLRGTVVLPTEPRLFQYYALTYSTPIDTSGTTVQVSAGYLRTRPKSLPLQGDATTFGVQVSRPLIRGYDKSLYLTGSIDGVNADSVLLGTAISNDHIRTGRLAASFSLSNSVNSLTLGGTVSHGLNILGERVIDPVVSKPDFTKVNAKINDNLQLSKQFVLRLDGFAQFSRDPLSGSEQMALGGDEFGRAYEAAIIAGDSGVAGSAELAFRPQTLPGVLGGSEAYVFVDGGRVWLAPRPLAPESRSDLASVGGGVRFQIAARSVIQLEAARGLTNPVFYEDRESWRLLVSARTLF
jgi:hemolysin activation/secretion protein